jgi:uncharacterized OB-fold protein
MTGGTAALPATGLTTREFFEDVRAGRLAVQRCLGCGALLVPPKAICPECEGMAWERAPLAGNGEVVSFTVIRVAPTRLAGETPYAIAVVRMTEGVSLLGRMAEIAVEDIRVGLPVRIVAPADPGADPPVITFTPRATAS